MPRSRLHEATVAPPQASRLPVPSCAPSRETGDFGVAGLGASAGGLDACSAAERQIVSRQSVYAELCRRLVIETHASAAVLINRSYECLYSVGPTDRYLRVPPGHPTHDLLAMARQDMRTRLRSAIQQARDGNMRVILAGGRMSHNGHATSFNIDVQPVQCEGEELSLICFIDEPARELQTREVDELPGSGLALELELTRAELRNARRKLEIASEDQKTAQEEALSISEEYQSTHEELLTSKEEQQSLNEELTALNAQLQESLEQQRAIANDLQNVLYSTDVATVFLDGNLNIRFFTPATRSLFSVIPSDIGRPIADLTSLAAGTELLTDAETVMRTLSPIEREIEGRPGTWYSRRISPYRAQDSTEDRAVAGVVITFVDVTGRRRVADELETAKRQAESANIVKSRFLAAASHDLRQPLQTLALVHGLLARTIEDENAQKLIARLDETLTAMSGMLNTLLDINQIETSSVQAEMTSYPINELLERLKDEFTYHAHAKRLTLRVVPCSLLVHSDPRLLEQMIRNLLSNALKYTRLGKVLLGCRRHNGMLSIEVRDTGIGIPDGELHAIFDEYHQLDNPARERSRGLGLGLAIVQRLGKLLGHQIRVRSRPGKGSVFAIDVALPPIGTVQQPDDHRRHLDDGIVAGIHRTGQILVIEDDPEIAELLEMALRAEGHATATATDAAAALELLARSTIQPDLILADYNLPDDVNGLRATAMLQARLHRRIPAVILTGDISTATLRDIARANCLPLNKPVKLRELTEIIQRLLPISRATAPSRAQVPTGMVASQAHPVIFVVDDDDHVREGMRALFEADGRTVEDYASCEAFLAAYQPRSEECLVIDAYLPGMSGLQLLRRLRESGHQPPAIMITGHSDVSMAVQAMKAGVSDFIEKPALGSDLLACVGRALEQSRDQSKISAWRDDAAIHVGGLTARQRQIMHLVLAGHHSKNIALDLGISRRTVENHRAAIMKKTGTKSLPALARLALAAGGNEVVRAPREPKGEDPALPQPTQPG
jgi:two-component system, chemotaxis family, CheB/CheR fusion protein